LGKHCEIRHKFSASFGSGLWIDFLIPVPTSPTFVIKACQHIIPVILRRSRLLAYWVLFPVRILFFLIPTELFYLDYFTARSFAMPIRFTVGTGKAQDDVTLPTPGSFPGVILRRSRLLAYWVLFPVRIFTYDFPKARSFGKKLRMTIQVN
jgi:hypothetical protein